MGYLLFVEYESGVESDNNNKPYKAE